MKTSLRVLSETKHEANSNTPAPTKKQNNQIEPSLRVLTEGQNEANSNFQAPKTKKRNNKTNTNHTSKPTNTTNFIILAI